MDCHFPRALSPSLMLIDLWRQQINSWRGKSLFFILILPRGKKSPLKDERVSICHESVCGILFFALKESLEKFLLRGRKIITHARISRLLSHEVPERGKFISANISSRAHFQCHSHGSGFPRKSPWQQQGEIHLICSDFCLTAWLFTVKHGFSSWWGSVRHKSDIVSRCESGFHRNPVSIYHDWGSGGKYDYLARNSLEERLLFANWNYFDEMKWNLFQEWISF